MSKKLRFAEFLKRNKNVLYLVLICVSALVIIISLATELKRNYFYVIGEFDTPEMLIKETTAAQFGRKTLSSEEYRFMYYSYLYSMYPELKSKKFVQISNYINTTEYSDGESIAQAVQRMTEDSIVKMYSYLQDAADKGIKIDASDKIKTYTLSLTQEAEKLNLSLDEYLSAYYGVGSSLEQISSVIEDYQTYRVYEHDILKEMVDDISDEEYEALYLENSDVFDLYYLSFLSYEFGEEEGDEKRQEIKDSMSKLYEDVHSRDDFSKLGQEFCEKYAESGGIPFFTDDNVPFDYYSLYMINADILEWAADASRKQDSVAMFDCLDGYIIVYFNDRQRDERETYNGLVVTANREMTIEDGFVVEPTLYASKEKSPYYQSIKELYASVLKMKDSDRSSDNIVNLISTIDISKYSESDGVELVPMLLENSLLDDSIGSEEVLSWASSCKDGSVELIEAPPYYSIIYISSKGLPVYKANINNLQYNSTCSNIESSYSPMFSNISYSQD